MDAELRAMELLFERVDDCRVNSLMKCTPMELRSNTTGMLYGIVDTATQKSVEDSFRAICQSMQAPEGLAEKYLALRQQELKERLTSRPL